MKEIFYANLIVIYHGREVEIKEVVYKDVDGYYDNVRVLSKYGIKNKVSVKKFHVIKSLGFENVLNTSTEVKVSDEKRNNISGAYE